MMRKTSPVDVVRLLVAMAAPRLVARGGGAARAFVEQALAPDLDHEDSFVEALLRIPLDLGSAPLHPTSAECEYAARVGVTLPLRRLRLSELCQVILLASRVRMISPSESERLIARCFRDTNTACRVSILRALAVLPEAERFVSIAWHGVTEGDRDLVEAIACENPFPSAYFDDGQFRRMLTAVREAGLPLEAVIDPRRSAIQSILPAGQETAVSPIGHPRYLPV